MNVKIDTASCLSSKFQWWIRFWNLIVIIVCNYASQLFTYNYVAFQPSYTKGIVCSHKLNDQHFWLTSFDIMMRWSGLYLEKWMGPLLECCEDHDGLFQCLNESIGNHRLNIEDPLQVSLSITSCIRSCHSQEWIVLKTTWSIRVALSITRNNTLRRPGYPPVFLPFPHAPSLFPTPFIPPASSLSFASAL